ncbi:MAG: hypothetical protein WC878_01540 [Candidatus Paceibacterota bacterium]|jgi:hypothetical protein
MADNTKEVRRNPLPREHRVQLWEARKAFAWGMGFKPVGDFYKSLPEGITSVRLDVKNKTQHEPVVGEVWEVNASFLRHTKGSDILFVECRLIKKVSEAKEKSAPKPHITRGNLNKQDAKWKANVVYDWGMGFVPVEKEKFESIFPDQEKSLRLNIKNKDEHHPVEKEEWVVTGLEWRHKDGDVDPQGRLIVHIDGLLKEKVVECEKKFNRRTQEVVKIIRSGEVVENEEIEKCSKIITPYTDPKRPDRIIYMECYVTEKGKVEEQRYHSEEPLEEWKENRAVILRGLIEDMIEKPYVEKYEGELRDSVKLPKERGSLHA